LGEPLIKARFKEGGGKKGNQAHSHAITYSAISSAEAKAWERGKIWDPKKTRSPNSINVKRGQLAEFFTGDV